MLLLIQCITCTDLENMLTVYLGKMFNPQDPYLQRDMDFFTFCKSGVSRKGNRMIDKLVPTSTGEIGLKLKLEEDQPYTNLCVRGIGNNEYNELKRAIQRGDWIELIIGDIVGTVPLGQVREGKVMYYSHWKFNMKYAVDHLVGFDVECKDLLDLEKDTNARFYYSVEWNVANGTIKTKRLVGQTYGARSDMISLAKVMLYVLMFVSIYAILLSVKIANQTEVSNTESNFAEFEAQMNQSWTLLHGDVFRPPQYLELFSVLNGFSFHLILAVLVSSLLNYFFELYRDTDICMTFLMIYIALSIFSGYMSASISAQYEVVSGKTAAFTVFGFHFPSLLICLILSLCNAAEIQSKLVIVIMVSSICISYPCVMLGAKLGAREPLFDAHPCQIAAVPWRESSGTINTSVLNLLAGSTCSFMFIEEASVILVALQRNALSWMFVSLLLTMLCVIVISGSVSIGITYLLLNKGFHRWQWRSFIGPFASSVFVFVYCVQYIITKTEITGFPEKLVSFTYAAMLSTGYGLACGVSGFLSSNIFVNAIFRRLKIE